MPCDVQTHRMKVGVFQRRAPGISARQKSYLPLDPRLSIISLKLALTYKLMTTMIYNNYDTLEHTMPTIYLTDKDKLKMSNVSRLALSLSLLVLLAGDVHVNPGPPGDRNTKFKIASLNARSIKRVDYIKDKLTEFKIMCQILDPDVFVISESWLKDFIENTEVIGPAYQVHRNDRKGKGGEVSSSWLKLNIFLKKEKN